MDQKRLDISWSSILKVVVTFSILYFVFLVHDVLLLSLFGLIISILFEWPVRTMSQWMPRTLAVLLLYAFFVVSLSFLVYFPISSLVSEIKEFIKLLPFYFEQVSPPLRSFGFEAFQDLQSFTEALDKLSRTISSNVLNAIFYIFGGISSSLYVLSISLFLSLEGKKVQGALQILFPSQDEEMISRLWLSSEKKVGLWFLRIILGCLFLGVASYLSFLVIDVKYPLSLAFLAGIANFVPIVGPLVATLILFMIIALTSTSKAILAALIYGILQQIENNILGPLLFKKLTGISPTLIIVGLAIGAKLAGALGAVLMVPLLGVLAEFGIAFLKKAE